MHIELTADEEDAILAAALKASGIDPDSDEGWELWRDLVSALAAELQEEEEALRLEMARRREALIRELRENPERLAQLLRGAELIREHREGRRLQNAVA